MNPSDLFVDAANNSVGIGTRSPSVPLNVTMSYQETFRVNGYDYKIIIDNLETDDIVKVYVPQNGFRSTYNINEYDCKICQSPLVLTTRAYMNQDTYEKIKAGNRLSLSEICL